MVGRWLALCGQLTVDQGGDAPIAVGGSFIDHSPDQRHELLNSGYLTKDGQAYICVGRLVTPMADARIESFLADVLALEGEDPNAIRESVRVAIADCEQIFRAQEANRRMKDKAAHACHALCRTRIVEEIKRRKGTVTSEHLKVVLSVIDGPPLRQ